MGIWGFGVSALNLEHARHGSGLPGVEYPSKDEGLGFRVEGLGFRV